MGSFRKMAEYLYRLPHEEYGLAKPVSGAINYLIDSYFAKLQQLTPAVDMGPQPPLDPSSDIKEKWLGCEIHKCLVIHQDFPSFSRSLNAHAFAMLFAPYGGEMADYKIVSFLDSYEWKGLIKGSYEWRLQQEGIQISPLECRTLPIYGTFFVLQKSTGKKLVVKIDLCYESMGCKFTVSASPTDKGAAEKFLVDLNASRTANDIYFKQVLSFEKSALNFCPVTDTKWADIILKPEIKEAVILNSIDLLGNSESLSNVGLTPARNILLISPPGMAKTTIFRAISNESKDRNTVIWCTGKSIKTADDVTSLFDAARSLAPCIIMIEDMDLFGRDRSSGIYEDANHVLNEFLACLDGTSENSGVVVMASTNDVASMDEALVNRPGRFDVKLEMPLPDESDRLKMMGAFCRQYNANCVGADVEDTIKSLIGLTEGMTGAYVKDLIKTAVIRAVSKKQIDDDGSVMITSDDLLTAVHQILKNFEIGKKAKKHHQILESGI
jgi:AAA+ superfamily predicted ATPase